MSTLRYINGSVTNPQLAEEQRGWPVIIPHVVNDKGAMGAGVAKALYTTWPKVKEDYLNTKPLVLGGVVDTIAIPGWVYVQSMIAQTTPGEIKTDLALIEPAKGWTHIERPPIRYGALAIAMRDVGAKTSQVRGSIHAPRFGSDLAEGDWSIIESLILELWVDQGIDVTIYNYRR